MKLFIQIPCLNEENTLPEVIASIPHEIQGIDEIYTLVIDDGCTDKTADIAQSIGVDYIVKNRHVLGLARSFCRGIEVALELGADIIVNLDGDNQYKASDIPALIQPILDKQADIVVGCRDIDGHKEFSPLKKSLQKFGSKVVCELANVELPDVTSGFRALHASAAKHLSIMSTFSYTLEMLCQATRLGLKTTWIPVGVNPKRRESRLFRSTAEFIYQQCKTFGFVFLVYYPIRFFGWLTIISGGMTVLLGLWYFQRLSTTTHTIHFVSGTFLVISFLTTILLLLATLLGSVLSHLHRILLDTRSRVRTVQIKQGITMHDYALTTAPEFFRWKQKL
ncbi:MAG: glycosyltransferase family 2 protein [Candidatus Omnitrophica bacterium]|nr:glycosyltransferase family 2 protein [Candidatus Omnitrophota bacterium]